MLSSVVFTVFNSIKTKSYNFSSVSAIRNVSRMAENVPCVDIDPSGTFKYILIKLTIPLGEGQREEKNIVRGYASCPYHSDINDKVTEELQKLKSEQKIPDWRTKVLGGGRIQHDPDMKLLSVYGYSQGYGQADHKITVEILKKKYSDYTITSSNEGY